MLSGSRGSIRGDIHFYGKQGMYFYTQVKTITSLWDYKSTDGMNARYHAVLMTTPVVVSLLSFALLYSLLLPELRY